MHKWILRQGTELWIFCDILVTVGCLVMQQRYERKYSQYRALLTAPQMPPPPVTPDDEENLLDAEQVLAVPGNGAEPNGSCSLPIPTHQPQCSSINCGSCPTVKNCEIEDLVDSEEDDQSLLFSYNAELCSPSKHPCDAAQRRHCRSLLERYRANNQLTEPEEMGILRDRDDEFQMLRHIILLLFLSISMFVVSQAPIH